MNAFKCDTCKKFFEGSPYKIKDFISQWSNNQGLKVSRQSLELCQCCYVKITNEIKDGFYKAEKVFNEISKGVTK